MFNCAGCKTTQPQGVRPLKMVVEKREQTYNNQGRISRGWEIVRELSLCHQCAIKVSSSK